MKIRVDANKKEMARQIAVTIPKNATLLGLIMSGDRALHTLVRIKNRFYSLCCSTLRSLPPTIEIDWIEKVVKTDESANFGFKPPYQRGAHDFMKKCKATHKNPGKGEEQ
jgi:hypothetical protein